MAVTSKTFSPSLFVNTSHSCLIILHFSTLHGKKRSMFRSVKSCHEYSVLWGFKVTDSLSRIFQILHRLSFLGSFTRNSNIAQNSSPNTFPPPETINTRASKQESGSAFTSYVASATTVSLQTIDFGHVSASVTSGFKKVEFLRDSTLFRNLLFPLASFFLFFWRWSLREPNGHYALVHVCSPLLLLFNFFTTFGKSSRMCQVLA